MSYTVELSTIELDHLIQALANYEGKWRFIADTSARKVDNYDAKHAEAIADSINALRVKLHRIGG